MKSEASLPGIPFVISAPSGGGKTTVCRELKGRMAELASSVSYTTRPARPGETAGRDYHFVSQAEFEGLMRQGRLAEWTRVHNYYYGTPADYLEKSLEEGRDVVLTLDIEGAKSLKKKYHQAVTVFLLPPSLAELRARLAGRGTEDDSVREERIRVGLEEIKQARAYDYLIVNRDLEETVSWLEAIVAVERLRPWRVLKGYKLEIDVPPESWGEKLLG